jgi:hypothetical protein
LSALPLFCRVLPPASPTVAEFPFVAYDRPRKEEELMKARMLVALVSVAAVLSSVAAGFCDGR